MSDSWASADNKAQKNGNGVEWNVQQVIPVEKPAFGALKDRQGKSSAASRSTSSLPPAGYSSMSSDSEKNSAADAFGSNPQSAEIKHLLALLAAALDEIAAFSENEHEHMTKQIVDLGLTLAGELAAGAIAADPARVSALVKEALVLMEEEAVVYVRIHPDIYKMLNESRLISDLQANPRIQIRPDAAAEEAGCLIESVTKRVDARVNARIKRVRYLMQNDIED